MTKKILIVLILVVLALPAAINVSAQTVELRFACYSDGTECPVYEDLLNRFSEENPDITVIVEDVGFNAIRDNLRVQVEAGEAPDIARIVDFAGMAGYYLDLRPLMMDSAVMEDNYNPVVLAAFRQKEGEDNGLYGFPDAITATGPYVNRTLFEQAGIEVPSDVNPEATWEEWTAALVEVAEATGTPYAVTIDNKGHRFAGPAMSMGATFFDEDGNFDLQDDEGYRAFAELVKSWHDDGITPAEVWLGSGGQYTAGVDFFINAQVVMYFSGSWQIARLNTDVGDAFDWAVVPNPTGPGGSTGVAGGAGIVGFGQTEHPEEVARVLEYLMQPEVAAEFSARTLNLPANLSSIAMGIDFQTDSDAVKAALTVFANEVAKLQDQAIMLNLHPLAFAYYDSSNNRLAQYFAGELTLDEAMERLQQDLDDAAAAQE